MHSLWISLAALFGFTGVGLAAYTSHGLGYIADPAVREVTRATLQQAVQQQMLHALVLLATGLWAMWQAHSRNHVLRRWLSIAAGLFTVGVLLFSGLIYLRIFTGIETLRAMVPWGGSCLMLGWLALGVSSWHARR